LPYVFLRNTAHINLVYYAVSPICSLSAFILLGCPKKTNKSILVLGFVAILAQGLGYLYFSFYASILLFFSAVLGYAINRDLRVIKIGSCAIVLIITISSINLLPAFISWSKYGKPDNMAYKNAKESEIYALKLRQMLSPHKENKLPILSLWGKSDSSVGFPLENENVTARLGLVASIGMVLLFLNIFVRILSHGMKKPTMLDALSILMLFTFLFTTMGGLGAIFNQFISEFRCYNRFSVFIGFFALGGFALWVEKILDVSEHSYFKKVFFYYSFFIIFAASIYDQLLDAGPLLSRRVSDEVSSVEYKSFVKNLEEVAEFGSSIYQLPIRPFPADGGDIKMLPYEHAMPFFYSKNLRWSWPSFSPRHQNWQNYISKLTSRDFTEALSLSGFSAVWIDKYGYLDSAKSVIDELMKGGAEELISSESGRFTVLDLRRVEEGLKSKYSLSEIENRKSQILNQPIISCQEGFYPEEINTDGKYLFWSKKESAIQIMNPTEQIIEGYLLFDVASDKGAVSISGGDSPVHLEMSPKPLLAQIPLTIAPHERKILSLVSTTGRIELPPGETRDLHFVVFKPTFLLNNTRK
jgi:phosphoglycerol transferase